MYTRIPDSEAGFAQEDIEEAKRVSSSQHEPGDHLKVFAAYKNAMHLPTRADQWVAGVMLLFMCIAAFGTMIYFLVFYLYLGWMGKPAGYCEATTDWRGWESMEHSFVFGDSWSDTGFDPFYPSSQPDIANPLGNPAFPGLTSANATNWVGFLTGKRNDSLLLTYNLAVSNATLDNHIIQGNGSSLTSQVYSRFMPTYGSARDPHWNASNTLFAMFPGVEDVVMMNDITNSSELAEINTKLTARLTNLLEALHGAGGRNFLLLNVPPLERTWQSADAEKLEAMRTKFKIDVTMYNERIQHVAQVLKRKSENANVFVYDTNSLFNRMLDNVKAFPETSDILNTMTPCSDYSLGTPTIDYFNSTCSIPVNQYFWLDGMHSTYSTHDVLAGEVATLLRSGPNVC